MDFSKYESALVLLDDTRIPLELKRSVTIRNLGPKLLEPIMDQSLDPGDMEKISEQIFNELKTQPEFQKYLGVRKEINKKLTELFKAMEKAKDADWEQLIQAELAATTKNDLMAMAKAKGMRITV